MDIGQSSHLNEAEQEQRGGAPLVEYVEQVEAASGAHGETQQKEEDTRANHNVDPVPEQQLMYSRCDDNYYQYSLAV